MSSTQDQAAEHRAERMAELEREQRRNLRELRALHVRLSTAAGRNVGATTAAIDRRQSRDRTLLAELARLEAEKVRETVARIGVAPAVGPQNLPRDSSGELAKFAWPGGYPLFYIGQDEHGEQYEFCQPCASQAGADPEIVAADVNWESEMVCDGCGAELEAAYGVAE